LLREPGSGLISRLVDDNAMIVVKLMGGLGNQLFQYAFAMELKQLYGEDICFDCDSYSHDMQRSLSLNNVNIDEFIDWNDVLPEITRKRIKRDEKIYRVIQRVLRAVHRSDRVGPQLYNRYLKRGYYFNFDPYFYSLPLLKQDIKVAYGYFQGEEYFKDVRDKIKESFKIRDGLKKTKNEIEYYEQIKSVNAVCVHLRVGDYKTAKNKRFDVIRPEYVQRAVECIKCTVINPVFFVFTNDVDSVEKDYKIENAVYVTGLKDYQDMRLMESCKHFIISNSTFSWWASFLADYENKMVIVPRKWRRNQEDDPALMHTENIEYIRM